MISRITSISVNHTVTVELSIQGVLFWTLRLQDFFIWSHPIPAVETSRDDIGLNQFERRPKSGI